VFDEDVVFPSVFLLTVFFLRVASLAMFNCRGKLRWRITHLGISAMREPY
jgi:hypothetical protein